MNVRLGARYLAMMLREFDGDRIAALAAYNAGPGPAEALEEAGPRPRRRRVPRGDAAPRAPRLREEGPLLRGGVRRPPRRAGRARFPLGGERGQRTALIVAKAASAVARAAAWSTIGAG